MKTRTLFNTNRSGSRHRASLAISLLFALAAHAYELVPHPDAETKFEVMERNVMLYDQTPYTIEQALTKNEVAGMSIVILYDGKPALHKTYGQRIKRTGAPTTSDTIYQCASMSKLVSSLGLVTAARRGDVDLDESLTSFSASHPNSLIDRWADTYFTGEAASWDDDVTLRRLLSHSAGLSVHGIAAAPWLPSNDPLESILFGKSIFKSAVKPIHEPGTKYDYSGGGYTAAEAWLEIASGRKFKDYLKQHVLDPLGMTKSTFETGSELTPNLAWGCSRGVCLYDVRTLDVKAAGGLLCHPVDYARLVALLLNGGKEYLPTNKGAQLIPADDVAAILTPSVHKDTGAPLPSSSYYGLGVSLSSNVSPDGLPVRFDHGGAQQGVSNEFYAHRNSKLGVVILVNGNRDWVSHHEVYGGATLATAVLKAFKVAYGLESASGPLKPRCIGDSECANDQYCKAGVDFVANECKPKKADNATCDLIDGDRQCQSGRCRAGRCYTPNSVPMGSACYVDEACIEGKCSSIDGTRGTCVCQDDVDCGSGKYCNAGLDLSQNSCLPKKADNSTCDIAGGGHQCVSGQCSYGRCYTPNSVPIGGTCYVNAACSEGHCSSVQGTRGTCVCSSDSDCDSGRYCNAGIDLTQNQCLPKKADNSTCDIAGGGHQCVSGYCSYGRCYTPGSVPMGGACYVNAACAEGKCSSVQGTRGTCVCERDSDCDSDEWCDAGLDLTLNRCREKLDNGETCGSFGSVGNDHKCKSGNCSGFPSYTCN